MRIRKSGLWMFVAGALLFAGCGDQPRRQASQAVPDTPVEKGDGDGKLSDTVSGQRDVTPPSPPLRRGGDVGEPGYETSVEEEDGEGKLPDTVAGQRDATRPGPPLLRGRDDVGEPAAEIAIVMEDCKASRPGKVTGNTSLISLIFSGPPKDKLVKRGTLTVEGQDYTLYLPRADSYSTTNTGEGDSDFENTSTLISVDHNGDGKLTGDEGWFANLPLRLGEKMFDVAEIAEDGSRVVLKPSASPLRGVIVGRICPPFSYKTAEGDEVSFETLAGKAFILDIWSFT